MLGLGAIDLCILPFLAVDQIPNVLPVISSDFPLEMTGFFPGMHLIHFLLLKMRDFRNFVLQNCILDLDAEQVYLKPQVTKVKQGSYSKA